MNENALWEQCTTDLYVSLGVSTRASDDEIQTAWRNAARQHHPDSGGDAQQFAEVHLAYLVLSDPSQRNAYDRHRLTGLAAHGEALESTSEPEWDGRSSTYERPRTLWLLAAIALLAVIGSYIWPAFTVVTGIAVGIIVLSRYQKMGFGLTRRR